ncbi:methyltransferase, FxLD system [Saccharothrix saharensis]|uniref:methyltransferase, FxLD system n=1 Tax=Saccharothrix saharensis TaxID=571190 RepID=UPI00369510D3
MFDGDRRENRNVVNGDVHGSVLQVGRVDGGLHVHVTSPESAVAPGGADAFVGTIADADPFVMGVHRARHPTGVTEDDDEPAAEFPPAYVMRPHDVRLRAALRRVAEEGAVGVVRMVVLTGESSVGKTRALWEAVRATLPDWELVAPATAAELCAVITADRTRTRGVVWLDEAQRFFDGPDGATAARLLSRLLSADPQVVVLATMWARPYWESYTASGRMPDVYGDVRRLFTGARTLHINVPDRLDRRTLAEFADRARNDSRMAVALAAGADDGRVIQHLTGGPELLEALLHHTTFTPVETALITTAIDARHLGHFRPVPAVLLTDAADGYLDRRDRPDGHVELHSALADLARGRRDDGSRTDIRHALTALTELRHHVGGPVAYEPDDYLLQHKVDQRPEPVPGSLWNALVRHTAAPEDRLRLGRVAAARGLRRIAVALMAPVAATAADRDLRLLADLCERAGKSEQAQAVLAAVRSDEGISLCGGTTTLVYDELGRALLRIDLEGSSEVDELRRHAHENGPPTAGHLVRNCRHHAFGVAVTFAQAARVGFGAALNLRDTLLSTYHPVCDLEDPLCREACAVNHNRDADIRHWRTLATVSGDIRAMRVLARLATLQECFDEAEELLRCAAEVQPSPADRHVVAERAEAMRDLCHLLRRLERPEEAGRWLRRSADAGDLDASCELLVQRGQHHEALRLLRHAVEAGVPLAEEKLAERLRRAGRAEEADRLTRFGIEPGGATAAPVDGSPFSSISAPQVQAYILEKADLVPGMSVLEIGSGGYNAASPAGLVGPSGRVVTVDIDPDVTDRASRFLDEAGCSGVGVVLGDADGGVPEYAPYDRILVTVGARNIPQAWISQLADGGLLLVPMVIKDLPLVIVFERDGQGLVSREWQLFGFVPVRGAGAHRARQVPLRGAGVTLKLDTDIPVDAASLEAALSTPRVEVWTGSTLGRFEPWADAHLWLASALPGSCRLLLGPEKATGLAIPPGWMNATSAVVDGTTLAYVITRKADEDNIECGVHAYDTHAAELAQKLAELLRVWSRDHRGGPRPRFHVAPPRAQRGPWAEEHIVAEKHSRLTISWPEGASIPAPPDPTSRNDW